jgi:hypothetical protein
VPEPLTKCDAVFLADWLVWLWLKIGFWLVTAADSFVGMTPQRLPRAFAAIQAARRSTDATRSMLARVRTGEILRVKRFATRLTRTTLAKEVL